MASNKEKQAEANRLRKEIEAADLRAELSTPQPEAGPSQAEAFGRGALQGATLGFADEITAGAEASFDSVKAFVTGDQDFEGFLNSYSTSLNESRTNFEAAAEAHPGTSLAGSVVGGVGGALAGGAAGIGAKLGTKAAAALSGAAFGAGSSEASVTQGLEGVTEIGKDIAVGGLLGGAVAGAGQVLGKVASSVAGKLGVSSQQVMQKLGFNKAAFRTASGGLSADDAIQNLQKKGLIPTDRQGFLSLSPQELQKSLHKERKTLGATVGGMIKRVDDILPDVGSDDLGLRKLSKTIKKLRASKIEADIDLPLSDMEEFFASPINNASGLWEGKKMLDGVIHTLNKKLDKSGIESKKVQALFNARGAVKARLEKLVNEAVKKDPSLEGMLTGVGKSSFKELNADFGSIASVGRFVDDSAASAAKNERALGDAFLGELSAPSGVGGATVGALTTGGPGGAIIGGAIGAAARAAAKTGLAERAVVKSLDVGRGAIKGVSEELRRQIEQDTNIATKLYQSFNPTSGVIDSPEERQVHIGNVLKNKGISHAERFREVNKVNSTGAADVSKVAPHIRNSATQEIEDRNAALEAEVMQNVMQQLRGL